MKKKCFNFLKAGMIISAILMIACTISGFILFWVGLGPFLGKQSGETDPEIVALALCMTIGIALFMTGLFSIFSFIVAIIGMKQVKSHDDPKDIQKIGILNVVGGVANIFALIGGIFILVAKKEKW